MRRLHSRATSGLRIGPTTKLAPLPMYSAAVGASTTEPTPRMTAGSVLSAKCDELGEDVPRTVAAVGELDHPGPARGAGRHDLLGHLHVGMVEDRHQAGLDHRVQHCKTVETCHCPLLPNSADSPADTAGGVAAHQLLDLGHGDQVEVAKDGVLQAGGGHGKVERLLRVSPAWP